MEEWRRSRRTALRATRGELQSMRPRQVPFVGLRDRTRRSLGGSPCAVAVRGFFLRVSRSRASSLPLFLNFDFAFSANWPSRDTGQRRARSTLRDFAKTQIEVAHDRVLFLSVGDIPIGNSSRSIMATVSSSSYKAAIYSRVTRLIAWWRKQQRDETDPVSLKKKRVSANPHRDEASCNFFSSSFPQVSCRSLERVSSSPVKLCYSWKWVVTADTDALRNI